MRPKSRAKPKTTKVLPGIDVAAESELINQGHGKLVADSRYLINGRVYLVKPDGAAYPESGEGVISVDRPTFLALRELIAFGGRTPEFDRATEHNPTYAEDVIREALELFEIRKGRPRCT